MYKEQFAIDIDTDGDYFVLNIKALSDTSFDEKNFLTRLQEQQLREDLSNEFGPLRDKIYEKAFCKVSDSVGL